MIEIWRQPGSNTLQLVDRIKKMLPQLQAGIPPSVKLTMVSNRSLSISASFSDVKITLGFTIVLVVLVIFAFLRSFWATVIPSLTGSEVEHMHLPDEAHPRAAAGRLKESLRAA